MSRGRGDPSRRTILREWPWQVYTLVPTLGFGTMLDRMHAFCHATNKPSEEGIGSGYHKVSASAPGKPAGCLWCFKRQQDAIAFSVWCEANGIVDGDKAPQGPKKYSSYNRSTF